MPPRKQSMTPNAIYKRNARRRDSRNNSFLLQQQRLMQMSILQGAMTSHHNLHILPTGLPGLPNPLPPLGPVLNQSVNHPLPQPNFPYSAYPGYITPPTVSPSPSVSPSSHHQFPPQPESPLSQLGLSGVPAHPTYSAPLRQPLQSQPSQNSSALHANLQDSNYLQANIGGPIDHPVSPSPSNDNLLLPPPRNSNNDKPAHCHLDTSNPGADAKANEADNDEVEEKEKALLAANDLCDLARNNMRLDTTTEATLHSCDRVTESEDTFPACDRMTDNETHLPACDRMANFARTLDYDRLPKAPDSNWSLPPGAMGFCAGMSPQRKASVKNTMRKNAYVSAKEDARIFLESDEQNRAVNDMNSAFKKSHGDGMSSVLATFLPVLKGMHRHIGIPMARVIALLHEANATRFGDANFRAGWHNASGFFLVEKTPAKVQHIVLFIRKGEVFLVKEECENRDDIEYLIEKPICMRIFGQDLYTTPVERDSFRMQSGPGAEELTEKAYYSYHYTSFFIQAVLDAAIGEEFPIGGLGTLFVRSLLLIWMFPGTVAQMLHRDDLLGVSVETYGDDIRFTHGTHSFFLMWQSIFCGPGWSLVPSKFFWLLHVPRPWDSQLAAEAYRQTGFISCEGNKGRKVYDLIKEFVEACKKARKKKNGVVPACKVRFAPLYDMLAQKFVVDLDHLVIGSSSAPHAGMGLKEADMADCVVTCPCGPGREEEKCPHVGYGDDDIPPLHIRRSYFQCLTRAHFMYRSETSGTVYQFTGTKLPKKFTHPVELFCYDEHSRLVGDEVEVMHRKWPWLVSKMVRTTRRS